MCSYATAAVTLPGAQQPRLAPVLPARCLRAVTAGLQFVRVTGALTLLGAQQPRLAPVLPPRLRQALTARLQSLRVTSALTLLGAQQQRLAPALPPDSSRAVTNHRRTALAGDVHVQLWFEQLQAWVVPLDHGQVEDLAAGVAHEALAPFQPPQRAPVTRVEPGLLALLGSSGHGRRRLVAGSDAMQDEHPRDGHRRHCRRHRPDAGLERRQ